MKLASAVVKVCLEVQDWELGLECIDMSIRHPSGCVLKAVGYVDWCSEKKSDLTIHSWK